MASRDSFACWGWGLVPLGKAQACAPNSFPPFYSPASTPAQSDPLPEIWEWSLLASLHLVLDHYVYDIEASGGEAANTSAMAFCVFYHIHPGSTTGDRW